MTDSNQSLRRQTRSSSSIRALSVRVEKPRSARRRRGARWAGRAAAQTAKTLGDAPPRRRELEEPALPPRADPGAAIGRGGRLSWRPAALSARWSGPLGRRIPGQRKRPHLARLASLHPQPVVWRVRCASRSSPISSFAARSK